MLLVAVLLVEILVAPRGVLLRASHDELGLFAPFDHIVANGYPRSVVVGIYLLSRKYSTD